MRLNYLLLILFWSGLFISCQNKNELTRGSYFTSLDPISLGIDFENNLIYNESFNVYLYRSFYNGGGVGIGDFNNDGLPDLFFCGNQEANKLYINKGNFTFQDATDIAGVSSHNVWSTGVSIVDINGDGWLDIYVCKSGKPDGENRHNELFINTGRLTDKGQPVFTESAKEYGIDDLGFSVHAAFFDMDKDGDLDMYLLNNSINPTDVIIDARKGLRNKRDPGGGNKLYRNDGGHFTDVSQKAGIYSSPIGFGLGVAIGDLNRDGWQDIYVSNDFFEKDYLYLNNGNGTFRECLEELINEISLGAMGVDIADVNNDGFPEIFVTEMLPERDARRKTKAIFDGWDTYRLKEKNGYYRQFPRNTFQLNNGGSGHHVSFSEISRLASVDATDWSWGVLMADFNNNGHTDIFITNGIFKDLLDQDYIDFYSDQTKIREMYLEKGAVIKDLIDAIPSEPIPNYLFTLTDELSYKNVSQEWGLGTPGFSNGAAFGDLDNDGDLDLVVNNINMPPFIYRNESDSLSENHFLNIALRTNSKNVYAVGAQVTLKAAGQLFFQELLPMRGSMSSVDNRLHFGLGGIETIDTLEIIWPDGSIDIQTALAADQFLVFHQEKFSFTSERTKLLEQPAAKLQDITQEWGFNYEHVENDFVDFDRDPLLYHMVSSEGPEMALGDVNNDGLQDIYIGGAKDTPGVLYQATNSGTFVKTNVAIFEQDKISEDTDAVFSDMDDDGDIDLLVASGGYEFPGSSFALADRLYVNDGSGHFTRSPQIIPGQELVSTSCLTLSDYDQDGDLDLFVGVRLIPFSYGVPPGSFLLKNDGKGNFTNVTREIAPGLQEVGMVTDALWSDVDKDGDEDLILVGNWMPIKVFRNNEGFFAEVTEDIGLSLTNGYWNVLEQADLDGDGDQDIIAGNLGLNTQFKATQEKPVSMFINDFDRNGQLEHIITTFEGDKAYPIAMKEDITKQMPQLRKKYLKHEDYKEKTVQDIFSSEQLSNALKLEVFQTNSMIFWNENGHFEGQPLPVEAQLGPVYSILVEDIDQDGKPDILIGGNLFRAKPQIGIYGGLYGVVLRSLGAKQFMALKTSESGFFVKGEIRDIKKMVVKGKSVIVVIRNNDSFKAFALKNE